MALTPRTVQDAQARATTRRRHKQRVRVAVEAELLLREDASERRVRPQAAVDAVPRHRRACRRPVGDHLQIQPLGRLASDERQRPIGDPIKNGEKNRKNDVGGVGSQRPNNRGENDACGVGSQGPKVPARGRERGGPSDASSNTRAARVLAAMPTYAGLKAVMEISFTP